MLFIVTCQVRKWCSLRAPCSRRRLPKPRSAATSSSPASRHGARSQCQSEVLLFGDAKTLFLLCLPTKMPDMLEDVRSVLKVNWCYCHLLRRNSSSYRRTKWTSLMPGTHRASPAVTRRASPTLFDSTFPFNVLFMSYPFIIFIALRILATETTRSL